MKTTFLTALAASFLALSCSEKASFDTLVIAQGGDSHGTEKNSYYALYKAIGKGAQAASVTLRKDDRDSLVLDTADPDVPTLSEALDFCHGKLVLKIDNPSSFIDGIVGLNRPDDIILYNCEAKGYRNIVSVDLDSEGAEGFLDSAIRQKPYAVELLYSEDANPYLEKAIGKLKNKGIRIMFNTSSSGKCGSHTDKSKSWAELIAKGGSVIETGELKTLMGALHPDERASSHGGNSRTSVDKSYDTALDSMTREIVPKFKAYLFRDRKSGLSLEYNLYVPEDYDPSKSYPLFMFIADGSTAGKGALYSLTQGWGGLIFATAKEQKKHPCLVLVPAFPGPESAVDDNWNVSSTVELIPSLIDTIARTYNVNRRKIYTSGQSMGGMISFYLSITHPDLFAASLHASSQWDTKVLAPMAGKKFFYIISAADPKASPKMDELGKMLDSLGTPYSQRQFSARLPLSEQDARVWDMLREGNSINFIRFDPSTVMPQGKESSMAEHMYGFDHAFMIEAVRDWIMSQEL